MTTQTIVEQVRWQDLKIRGEIDTVLEIAKQHGWNDCEIFGYGDMLTEPQESMGWDLIPADLYEHSIPPEAVRRLHQLINAGIRVQGVIIADDQCKTTAPASAPAPAPELVKPKFSLSSLKPILPWIGNAVSKAFRSMGAVALFVRNALFGLAEATVSLIGKALFGLIRIAGMLVLGAFVIYAVVYFFLPALMIGAFLVLCASIGGTDTNVKYDPKLVALVDDGNGRTVWVSLYTWYD